MAVTKVILVDWEGGEDADSATYRLRYWVETNDREDGPLTVRNAVGVTLYDTYASGNDVDNRALALSIKESRVSSGNFLNWFVDVEYGNPGERSNENPLLEPVTENLSWDPRSILRRVNADNTPILNTADDPFTEPLELEDNVPTVSYTINQATFPVALAQQIRNGVNNATWKTIFPAGTVKVGAIQTSRQFHKSVGEYYQVNYNFKIKPEGWQPVIDSYGWREKYTIGATTRKRSPPGLRTPLPLDGSGHFTTGAPSTITTDSYPEFDFAALFPFLV